MKRIFFTPLVSILMIENSEASVGFSKADNSAIPAGLIALITVISIFLIIGIAWLIFRLFRKKRPNAAPVAPRLHRRPRNRPRRSVIIIR